MVTGFSTEPLPVTRLTWPGFHQHKVEAAVLRADLSDRELSGNKYFKLLPNLGAAREAGHDTLLSFGGPWSNHLHALAAAGRRFAAEVGKRTNGELAFEIYPGSSLMKTVAQFSAVRKGALDLSLYPIPYAGGEVPEMNIGLMPGLVSSYKQGAAWKAASVGQKFNAFLAEKGVIMVSWIWQAGGVASRGKAIVNPEELRRFAQMLKKFNVGLSEQLGALSGQLEALSTSWRDQENHRFTEEFQRHLQTVARFMESNEQYIPFLLRKAERIDEYLQQR